MLRTRRRDNNVKPNRRLDRKSSRGMLYENEELRLKTININAEIERGQSDIKKLKRENEMLKKEIWCLRDEYDKLDKMLKDKKIDFSSSSTTYSSSSETEESGSSCTEESEEVETSQNLKNVQKTNLRNIHDQFDHLSIVTEETSFDNSDRNSLNPRNSVLSDQKDNMLWNYNDKDAIKPDQSYPMYDNVIQQNRSQTLPNQTHMNYFAPIQHSKSFDDNHFNQVHQTPLYPGDFYTPPQSCHNMESQTPPIAISPSPSTLYDNQQVIFPDNSLETENFLSKKIVHTNASNFYQNMVLVPKNTNPPPEVTGMEKKATDLIVKIDNQNFNKNLTYSNTTPSTTFSNGGNLEELLHDIESISQDILKLTDLQRGLADLNQLPTIHEPANQMDEFQGQEFYDPQIQGHGLPYAQNSEIGGEHFGTEPQRQLSASEERLHKSELNIVLMPKAMPLIGFDKYKNIQRSLESINSSHLNGMSASQQDLCIVPPNAAESTHHRDSPHPNVHGTMPLPPAGFHMDNSPNYSGNITPNYTGQAENQDQHNPFFFGSMTDNYVNSDYFNRRYNPENFTLKQDEANGQQQMEEKREIMEAKRDKTPVPENQSVENEENIKLKTTIPESKDKKQDSPSKKLEQTKSPKLSITRKVSIHFKGKKEKDRLKKLAIESNSQETKGSSSKAVQDGKKSSLFDFRVSDGSKEKTDTSPKPKEKNAKHQKTPSLESKKSTTETSNFDPKTPNSASDSDKKNPEKKEKDKDGKKDERKSRKSASVSPERAKHVHLIHEGVRKHKKHRRERSGTSRLHRASIDPRLRERSYSVCTDKSMTGPSIGLGLGMGYGSFLYEDYNSERERTNSGSSLDSQDNHRKMSGISNVPLNGKVPWCGCWGNGCL